ncbi:MAG: DNA-directed RNA polymerase subunit omega [Vicinamibacterales bacterium]
MVQRPTGIGRLEFAVLSSLRAAQLVRGCIPLVEPGNHKKTTTALMEVAARKILRSADTVDVPVVDSPTDGTSDIAVA